MIVYFQKISSEENISQHGTATLRSHCVVTNVTGEKPHVYLKQTELNNNSEKCENNSEKYENNSEKYENISDKCDIKQIEPIELSFTTYIFRREFASIGENIL